MFMDIHCHLFADAFGREQEALLDAMRAARVGGAILIIEAGDDPNDAAYEPEDSFALVEMHPDLLRAAVGVHPQLADSWDDAHAQRLRRWSERPHVVAIGEIGLDYRFGTAPRGVQLRAFDEQLDIALEKKLPVQLHILDAHGAATELLRTRCARGTLPTGVLHCYSGSWESAKNYLNMGFCLSLGGVVTYKNAAKSVEVAKQVPLDRLVLETDAPLMSPEPLRGRRNEPAYIVHTAKRIAELRGISLETLEAAATENTRRLFGFK